MWSKFSLFVIGTVLLGLIAILVLESEKIGRETVSSWEEDHRADCAVVLTGGRGRVSEGFSLLSQQQVRKLIVSGVFPGASLRDIFPQWPFYGEMHDEDVILEKRSRTTYGNAQQSLALVEALHCRDVVIVTSNLHMYRARRIFEAVFPENIPVYTRAVHIGSSRSQTFDLIFETIKSVFYDLWAY
ncbi:MAG: YdcF family protein [Bdellovibrionales bacterium]|nr:YdcF family protein [Bdellovibrionales bacterium]